MSGQVNNIKFDAWGLHMKAWHGTNTNEELREADVEFIGLYPDARRTVNLIKRYGKVKTKMQGRAHKCNLDLMQQISSSKFW